MVPPGHHESEVTRERHHANTPMKKKILVVLTSVEKNPTESRHRLLARESSSLREESRSRRLCGDYVSPKGGYTPINPHSLAMAEPGNWEWLPSPGGDRGRNQGCAGQAELAVIAIFERS